MAIQQPTSVLTRPANTTAYSQNDLIASNVTAGSIVVPSISIDGGLFKANYLMRRFRLLSSKTSGWDAVTALVEFWSIAPTFTNGDNGAYAVATGAAAWLGSGTVTLAQVADGAYGVGVPGTGAEIGIALAVGSSLFWSLEITAAGGATPASGQTFTLTPDLIQL